MMRIRDHRADPGADRVRGDVSNNAPVIERIVLAPSTLIVQGNGDLHSAKSTPLTVPGRAMVETGN